MSMRLVLPLATFLLATCGIPESAAVEDCERFLVGKLKAPSTYKRIKKYEYVKDDVAHVSIEYDAANAFGTPMRETQLCLFPVKNGRVDTTNYVDHDAALLNMYSDENLLSDVDALSTNGL